MSPTCLAWLWSACTLSCTQATMSCCGWISIGRWWQWATPTSPSIWGTAFAARTTLATERKKCFSPVQGETSHGRTITLLKPRRTQCPTPLATCTTDTKCRRGISRWTSTMRTCFPSFPVSPPTTTPATSPTLPVRGAFWQTSAFRSQPPLAPSAQTATSCRLMDAARM